VEEFDRDGLVEIGTLGAIDYADGPRSQVVSQPKG
jgi:hypothetical protein